jgi:hypothetical protein
MSELSGPYSWPISLTTTFGDDATPEWQDSVDADILEFIAKNKIRPQGLLSAYRDPLPNGKIGGTRYFTTRADADEWAALDRARATTIPRIIISQVISEV